MSLVGDERTSRVRAEDERTRVITELNSVRALYRQALDDHDRITIMSLMLGPSHPDGTQELKLANQTLKEATERYILFGRNSFVVGEKPRKTLSRNRYR